jgi:hypothetical protein
MTMDALLSCSVNLVYFSVRALKGFFILKLGTDEKAATQKNVYLY